MALISFGYRVDMDAIAPPTDPAGYIVAYDTDGVLKQKDHEGVVTLVGAGAPPAYKVFVATLTQNGSYARLDPGDEFIIGEKYFVEAIGQNSLTVYDDFSNIGYVGIYTPFTATGMTPSIWQYTSQVYNYDGVSATTQLTLGDSFIIGQEYVVQYIGQGSIVYLDDFTNIGYTEIGSLFIATGTTASSFTSSNTTIYKYDEILLPTVNVFENTLGITLIPEFYSSQACKLVSNLPVFIENKTITMPSTRFYVSSNPTNISYGYPNQGLAILNDFTLIHFGIMGGYNNGVPIYTSSLLVPIEIRVYN